MTRLAIQVTILGVAAAWIIPQLWTELRWFWRRK
jgi:hypothetical protein